jgi:hypothetical protein
MCKEETNINKDRTINTNERVLMLINEIMSDFTEVVKMLTGTMESQLSVIKEQEKNNLEITKLHAQSMNRQLDIIEKQDGFLSKFFDYIDTDGKSVSKIVEMWRQRKQSQQ